MRRVVVRAVAALLGIALLVAGVGWFRFARRAGRRFDVKVEAIAAATSPADVERGAHLSRAIAGCAECHGADLGGRVVNETAMFRLSAPNLTSGEGGVVGLASLPVFPAESIDHAAERVATPPRGPTRAYGIYLAGFCSGCHGKDFRGGIRHDPDGPASADISPAAMAGWTYEQLERALREGKRRDGTPMSAAMPWQMTRGLSDDEVPAWWLALRGTSLSRAGSGADAASARP